MGRNVLKLRLRDQGHQAKRRFVERYHGRFHDGRQSRDSIRPQDGTRIRYYVRYLAGMFRRCRCIGPKDDGRGKQANRSHHVSLTKCPGDPSAILHAKRRRHLSSHAVRTQQQRTRRDLRQQPFQQHKRLFAQIHREMVFSIAVVSKLPLYVGKLYTTRQPVPGIKWLCDSHQRLAHLLLSPPTLYHHTARRRRVFFFSHWDIYDPIHHSDRPAHFDALY